MLECASSCFRFGRRQLLRVSTKCIRPRPRRVLHSGFWHHGATDLDLPIWWAAASMLNQTSKSPTTASGDRHGVLLDFLYPEKTLALLRRLSDGTGRVPGTRRRRALGSEARYFASTWAQLRGDTFDGNVDRVQEARKEMKRLLKSSSAETELTKMLQLRSPEKQELAWQLYTACSKSLPEEKLPQLQNDLLEYLIQDRNTLTPSYILQVFDDLPSLHRKTSSYRAAIIAYIELRTVGPAIQLFEEGCAEGKHNTFDIGTDIILQRTVFDEQWDLSIRVFRTFLNHTPKLGESLTLLQIRRGYALKEIWSGIGDLPELEHKLKSLLGYVRQFQHELNSSIVVQEALSCFVMTFTTHVINHMLKAHKDERFLRRWFLGVFEQLHSLKLPTSACYEHAVKSILALPQYQQYTHREPIWQQLYRKFRDHTLFIPNHPFDRKPSQHLITEIIYFYGSENSLDKIDEYVRDLRSIYPGNPLKGGLLKFLVRTFADNGEAVRVRKYLHELRGYHPEEVDLKILSSLLFVYARRADVSETMAQFERIQNEFKLTPDAACWNILLLAYVRAEDLDGALHCFNRCVDSGTIPDLHTFGPLLDFCARRGDVEAFETLFARAKEMGLPVDSNVRARSGYVQAFLNFGDAQSAEAIAQGMLRDWREGTLRGHPLTHTWNLLIQHYALNRDLENSRVCYSQMAENDIPVDSWTYGSLMRALIEVKQTNAAFKILRETMPRNNLKAHALHYAIVMTGFLKEGQVDLALDTYNWMKAGNVVQTESSRQASIETLGTIDLNKLKKRKAKDPKYRLLQVENALQEMLIAGTGKETAHREPIHSKHIDSRNQAATPQAYYGLLISLYSARGGYVICKKLFQKAQATAPGKADFTPSIILTTAMMEAHYQAGKQDEVAKCWELAYTSTSRLTKTFAQAMLPESGDASESASLIDSSILERFDQSHISNNRRQILVKPTRIYIRSLLAQSEPTALQEAERTIRNLLVRGFAVDTFVWNEFISALALRARLLDAFAICETYLMPRFPGWRVLHPNFIRHDRQGYQWMEIRHHQIKRTTVIPRYKTLIILAQAYNQTIRDERNGVGYVHEKGKWMPAVLEEVAPMTIRAIQTMPKTSDKLQRRFFGDV